MIIAETIAQVRAQVKEWKEQGLTVGLVPTMGYLHEGHASLVDKAVSMCDRVVASDFVNPTQFGPNEDLESYPRDFDRDCALLEEHGCSMVFHPSVEEMYAPDAATFVEILSDMPRQLCGKTRPIHFRGVCTVVSKLFNIVTPDKAFFGQKDAQQLAIIRRMVRDMSYGIEIVGCPIVREADGLAMSSRNTYLSAEERKAALVLSKAVFLGEKLVREGETDADKIVSAMKACIAADRLCFRCRRGHDGERTSHRPSGARRDGCLHRKDPSDRQFSDGGLCEMMLNMLKGKIHRATVVQAELDYVGSITVDQDLLDAAGILEYEKVQIVDVNNGSRFETYTISGERGSGMICLNGAAARCVSTGDKVIIMCYAQLSAEEAKTHKPQVVFVGEDNRIERITTYEKHGLLRDMA